MIKFTLYPIIIVLLTAVSLSAHIDTLPPCKTFKDFPPDEKNRLQGLMTSYRELYKDQKYSEAIVQWRDIYLNAPGNNGKTKGFYDDGVNIYAVLMKAALITEQNKYADTIKQLHAKREVCFGSDGKYMGQKAFDYYFHIKSHVAEDETYNMFKKACDMNGNRMDYFTINPFMAILKSRLTSGKENPHEAGRLAHIAYRSMIEGIKTCSGNICESWKKVEEYTGKVLLDLEATPYVMTPDYYLDKYYQLFLKTPSDCITAKNILSKMDKENCNNNNPKYVEVKSFIESCK